MSDTRRITQRRYDSLRRKGMIKPLGKISPTGYVRVKTKKGNFELLITSDVAALIPTIG